MAYSSNTVSTPTALLQALVTWLVGRGWTQDMSQADGVGWRAHLHKGSLYVNFRAGENEAPWGGTSAAGYALHLYLGTGFSSGSDWKSQAGGPVAYDTGLICGVATPLANGTMTYHFLDDGSDNITVVVERVSTVFHYLSWGTTLTKAGAWTGGAYFCGSRSGYWSQNQIGTTAACPYSYGDTQGRGNAFVRADVDAFTGKWVSTCSNIGAGYQGRTGKSLFTPIILANDVDTSIPGYGTTYEGRAWSALNSQAILLPVHLYAERDSGIGGASLLGQVPGIFRSIATTKGFDVGSTIQLGADYYLLFPNFAVKKV